MVLLLVQNNFMPERACQTIPQAVRQGKMGSFRHTSDQITHLEDIEVDYLDHLSIFPILLDRIDCRPICHYSFDLFLFPG